MKLEIENYRFIESKKKNVTRDDITDDCGNIICQF